MAEIRAAVIGVGNMGRTHVRVYAEMEHVTLVGAADPDLGTAGKVTRIFGIPLYKSYLDLLDEKKPDIVSIATPSRTHVEIASEVMRRGIHVLIEKPLALSEEDGRTIIEHAVHNNVKLAVGHVERFNPAIIEIKKHLKNRELGRVFQIRSRRVSPFPTRIQDVGVVLDLATHEIDIMCHLTGSPVERAYAEIERRAHDRCEDMLSGMLRFQNGVIGLLDVNWLTPTKVRELAVIGEGGMYLADYLSQDVYYFKNAHVGDRLGTLSTFFNVQEGEMIKLNFMKKEPLRRELEDFAEAVTENRSPAVTGEDGLRAVQTARMLLESGTSHIIVSKDDPLCRS